MTRYRSTNKDIILISKYLYHFKTFQFNTVTSHTTSHLHTFHHTRCIRWVTQWARGPLAIMLTMRLLTNTMETVAFYNSLETAAFGCSNYFNLIAFSENVNCNGITDIFLEGRVAKLFGESFISSACFGEVIFLRLGYMVLFIFTKWNLEGIVTVRLYGLNLRNNTGTCFNDRTGGLLAWGIEDAGHPNLFTNNSFHFLYSL